MVCPVIRNTCLKLQKDIKCLSGVDANSKLAQIEFNYGKGISETVSKLSEKSVITDRKLENIEKAH